MGCRAVRTLALAWGLAACAPFAPEPGTGPAPAPPPPPPAVAPAPAPPPPGDCDRILRIEVRKSERVLRARCENGARLEMTAAMGREPVGPKREAGDLRTPEGLYHVSGGPVASRFHAFLPIDYPSERDAERALAAGTIDARDHARILRAHARGAAPPSDTPLGGDIGLHGEGTRWAGDSADLDWTLGCVAVPDRDLDFLLERTPPGTPVEILP